jgi:hypothetical protein
MWAIVAMCLLFCVPTSMWAGPPEIKVQDQTSTATASWFSYFVSLFQ